MSALLSSVAPVFGEVSLVRTSESIPWARASAQLSMNTSIFCWAVVAAGTYEAALAMHTLSTSEL